MGQPRWPGEGHSPATRHGTHPDWTASRIGVQHDPVHTVVPAGQQIPAPVAERINHATNHRRADTPNSPALPEGPSLRARRTELAVDHLGQCAGEGPKVLTPVDAGEFVEEPGYGLSLSVRQHRRRLRRWRTLVELCPQLRGVVVAVQRVWRASNFPDLGPNKVLSGKEIVSCRESGRASPLSLRKRW